MRIPTQRYCKRRVAALLRGQQQQQQQQVVTQRVGFGFEASDPSRTRKNVHATQTTSATITKPQTSGVSASSASLPSDGSNGHTDLPRHTHDNATRRFCQDDDDDNDANACSRGNTHCTPGMSTLETIHFGLCGSIAVLAFTTTGGLVEA